MQRAISFLLVMVIIMSACSSKRSTETEYLTAAYDQYNKGSYEEAIKNFKKIIEFYDNGQHAAKAMFMVGFINANHIKNYEEAKKYYNMFIEKYPQNELKNDAEFELQNLGKDINDLPIFSKIKSDSTQETVASE
jgi:outer membrane protein assembly factor BamD (BamD/ComL family)